MTAPAVVAAMDRLLALGGAVVERSFVDTHAGPLHVLEAGRGPTLLLLHGASGGGANWYRMIAPLARDYRVVALDLPGFGLSPARPLRAPLGLETARDLLGLDFLRDFSVVATSFGGLVALRLAQLAPERVRALVLIDSAGLDAGLPWALRLAARPPLRSLLRRPTRAGTAWMLDHLLTAGSGALPAEDRAALVDFIVAVEQAGAGGLLADALPLFCSLRGQREVLGPAELARIAVPVLTAWGERDRLLPMPAARRAAAAFPGARFAVVPGVGHSPNWEAPDRVLPLVQDFLRAAAA